ncbi:GNAT family N-acetyltransferase [Larkinella sp. VNQ87]|uniref:GNAT family N-acetyltransferase n=1 Tax=Larkinella sp. VNQ87 TaxID=3400921 RepID=UPI003C0FD109
MYDLFHVENPLPEQIPPFSDDGFLFLQARHLLNQPCRPLHYFALLDSKTGQAVARCSLFVRDGWTISPCAASFGSLEFLKTIPNSALDRLLNYIIISSKNLLVTGIRLVNYPDCYAPRQAARLRSLLLKAGFLVKYEELNQHRSVDERSFEEALHANERRRLRKCHQAGFTTQIWEKPDVDELFTFIQQARWRKKLPLSITRDGLANLLENFGDVCPVFTVLDQGQLIASCLGIRVRADILYYFLPADHEDYQAHSPSVLLVESLYAYCQQHGISLLDLGISTSQTVRNEGLIRFKRNLGASESLKLVFEKRF